MCALWFLMGDGLEGLLGGTESQEATPRGSYERQPKAAMPGAP